MFHAAGGARNYVAHEAVDEINRLAKAPNGIERWREVTASKLQNIALGKIIVAVLLSRDSGEVTPTKDAIDTYPKGIELWALWSNA